MLLLALQMLPRFSIESLIHRHTNQSFRIVGEISVGYEIFLLRFISIEMEKAKNLQFSLQVLYSILMLQSIKPVRLHLGTPQFAPRL